ncbi:MAG: HemK2/MTQ2 family protein methyltransferase [Candidatus Micrarchaeia archaeon]
MLELYGLRIKTNDKVYEPAEDSFLALKAMSKAISELRDNAHASVLDMGCGTGLIGLYAAKSRLVEKALLADKSGIAVKLAEENIALNKLESKAKAIRSDLFSSITGFFDIIVFNAPYLKAEEGEPKEEAEMLSGGKEGVELSVRFLKEAKKHMKQDAVTILVTSSLSNMEILYNSISNLGYSIKGKISEHFFFEEITAITLQNKMD